MAVTLELEHEDRAIVYRPVIFKVSSNRFDSQEGPLVPIAMASNGGSLEIQFASPHNWQLGDQLQLTGFTGIQQYNSYPRVIFIIPAPDKIVVDTLFLGTDLTGNVIRRNDNFNIRADVRIYDEEIHNILGVASDGGDAEFQVDAVHNYSVGDFVKIFDTASYDGPREITAINANDKFTIGGLAFGANETGFARRGAIRASKAQTAVREGSQDLFVFNINAILKSSISYDLAALGQSLTVDLINPTPDEIVNYEVIFTEQFQFGGAFADPPLVTNFKNYINATRLHLETQGSSQYYMDDPISPKPFLTNSPRRLNKAFAEEVQLSFMTDQSEVNVEFERWDNNGASLGISASGIKNVTDQRATIPVNSNIFTLAHSRIDIWVIETAGGSPISEVFRFDRDDRCYEKPVRFHWLNRLGGFDSYTFTADIKETLQTRRTMYEKGLQPNFNIKDRGKVQLSIQAQKKFEVFSDFLPDDYLTWLEELITSPEVYVIMNIEGNDEFVPINVLNTRTTGAQERKLTQLKIQYVYSNEDIIQGN